MNKDGIGKFTGINYFSEAEAYKKRLIENQDSPIVRKLLDYWNMEVFPSLHLTSQSDEEEDSASDGLMAEEADVQLDAVFCMIRLDNGSSHMMLSNKAPVPACQPQPIPVAAPAESASTELISKMTLVTPSMAPAATPDSNTPP